MDGVAAHLLAKLLVWDADYCRLTHVRMRQEGVLHIHGGDLVSYDTTAVPVSMDGRKTPCFASIPHAEYTLG